MASYAQLLCSCAKQEQRIFSSTVLPEDFTLAPILSQISLAHYSSALHIFKSPLSLTHHFILCQYLQCINVTDVLLQPYKLLPLRNV